MFRPREGFSHDLAPLGFGLLLVLLLVGGVVAYVNIARVVAHADSVAHTHEVIAALESLLQTMTDAETGQRGYLVTERIEYLDPYEKARKRLGDEIKEVGELTTDNTAQRKNLTDVQRLIDERLKIIAETITLAKAGDFAAARDVVASDRGKRVMDRLREVIAAMQAEERRLLDERAVAADGSRQTAIFCVLLTSILGVALVGGVFYVLRQGRSILEEQRERLRVTLASIGDGVLTTDTQARVTYLNDVAEELTGWTNDEAWERPVQEVFHIVNEDTEAVVPNPIERVLLEGVIVGLANHTVLISKKGERRPIDDSGAPIRSGGQIVGAVLVFRDVSQRRQTDTLLLKQKEVFERMVQGAPLDDVLEAVCEAVEQQSRPGAIATVMLADADGRTLRTAAGRNCPAEYVRRLGSVPIGEGVGSCGTSAARRETVIIEDIAAHPFWAGFAALAAEYHLRAAWSTPIVSREGRTLGTLGVYHPEPRAPEEHERQLLDVLARTAGVAIDRARTESDRRRFLSLAENSTDFIGMCDLAGVPFYVNRAGLELVGLDDLEAAKRTAVRDFFHPEDQAQVMEEFFPAVLARGSGEIEVRFRNFRTGAPIWMLYSVFTLPGEEGEPIALATLSRNIDERRRLEDNLRELAASLSDADRRKDEFIATLAHELRNPLAPIRTGLEVLKLASNDPQMVEEIRATMERQAQQMVRLIDDLLDVSRITQGKMQLRKCRVALADVVQSAVEATGPAMEEAHHQLSVVLPPGELALEADPARIAQVLTNLLSNAAKYTPEGGRIELMARREGDDVVMSVRDNGLGIPTESQARIFEMFAQIDRSMERGYKGLGIGLTLVKSLVEMHGGRVAVHSDGPGQGSEFTVRLPLLSRTELPTATLEADAPAKSEKRRILVVDDSRDAATMLGMVLRALGNDVRLAHDGIEAVSLAREYQPEVVFMDIGMPRLNGYEAAQQIRREPWGQTVRLVALTGWGQDEDRRRTRDAGFDHHLIKPAEPAALRQLLAELDGHERRGTD